MKIEPLGPQHDRRAFSCGDARIDDLLLACRPDTASPETRAYVAVDENDGTILGFYGLRTAVWEVRSGKTIRHRQAELELSMLGVRHDRHRRGIGTALMIDAFVRVLGAVEIVGGVRRLWLGAIDARARRFYQAMQFTAIDTSDRMMIEIDEIADAVEAWTLAAQSDVPEGSPPGLDDLACQVSNRPQLSAFILDLSRDVTAHPDRYENVDLPAFLEALSAWSEDMTGLPDIGADPAPSWPLFARMLLAATTYE